jgi:alanine dehydrogenase
MRAEIVRVSSPEKHEVPEANPMIVGVPREKHGNEHRVGLSPFAVSRLSGLGHGVLVEKGAGADAHLRDADYQNAGARIVYSGEEVLRRSDLVCSVARLTPEEAAVVQPGAVVSAFQHLAVAGPEYIHSLAEREVTCIAYELLEDSHGELPIRLPFSEMAGHMVLQVAAQYLSIENGGRGIMLGAVPTVAPPTVLILGAGQLGAAAARHAVAAGAHTIVIDHDVARLRVVHDETNGHAVTIVADSDRLERYTAIADVVIGAVHIPGGRAPFIVSRDMVRGMKQGSVIVDAAIDQGGCIETSRPTSLADPVFESDGVIHYCVPNMTASVPRTASRALASAALPYLVQIAEGGLDNALRRDAGLAAGVVLYRGMQVHPRIAAAVGAEPRPLASLLEERS